MVKVREALARLIPSEKVHYMYKAYDIIGDIIVTKIPKELDEYEQEVGKALHATHPTVRRVFRVIGRTEEVERNRQLRVIWQDSSEKSLEDTGLHEDPGRTIYVEYGCRFVVDVEKVFFTPRLSYERMRIAKEVKPGEVVAIFFGGVGTYAIIIAKVCQYVKRIYTIDVNPYAHRLANDNIVLNKCSGKVTSILGDAREVGGQNLRGLCNRVIMPLPGTAGSFLDAALLALKEQSECIINFYATVSGPAVEEEVEKVIDQTKRQILGRGAKSCQEVGWRTVREVGPRRYHIAIDLRTTS